jgi:anti-sigma B factor antagonist
MTVMSFELRTTGPVTAGTVPVVEVGGEIDAGNAASFEKALADLASPALVIDLSGAGYLDSAGFAVLDRLLARTALAVVVAPGSVLRTAAQLVSVPFHDTVDQARASLRPSR